MNGFSFAEARVGSSDGPFYATSLMVMVLWVIYPRIDVAVMEALWCQWCKQSKRCLVRYFNWEKGTMEIYAAAYLFLCQSYLIRS